MAGYLAKRIHHEQTRKKKRIPAGESIKGKILVPDVDDDIEVRVRR